LKVPENIRLFKQPPYSPELNPVEHVWDDIREKEFTNRAFDSIDSVIDTLCTGINRLANTPDYLKSMTGFSHIINSSCIAR
jgi:transposase